MAKIIIAEDHDSLRRLMRAQLEAMGHRTVDVADGEKALRQIRNSRFDLAVIDIGIPGPNGISVLKSVRTEGFDLPIIIISGGLPNSDLRQAQALADLHGASGFLFKPFDAKELQEMVARSLTS